MLYQPTNIYPSMTGGLGNGVVDASAGFKVTWQVNGNSPMLYYQIVIYANDAASTQKYSTGKLSTGSPFYGVDYAGNVKLFTQTISAATLSSAGITNGNEYKLVITQWWSAADFVTQTSASVFITRQAPTVSIPAISSPVTTRSKTFTASYYQAQGDSLNWVRWQLRLSESEEILKDTGNIYGTSQLRFDYDGLFSGNSYDVRCTVQTQNGVEATSGWKTFQVAYETTPLLGTLTACPVNGASGVKLTFPPLNDIRGIPSGTSVYIQNSEVYVPIGGTLRWDKVNGNGMNFPSPYTIAWRIKNDEYIENAKWPELSISGYVNSKTTTSTMPASACWDSIAYGNGVYAAVSASGEMAYSTDEGETWTSAVSPVSGAGWFSVCYGGGKFVAVACGSANAAYSTDGKTWTKAALPESNQWSAVCYGNGLFVAVSVSDVFAWSADGVTWTKGTMPASRGWYGVCYGNGRFVAVANSSAYAAYSDDGKSWAESSMPAVGFWNDVCYGNGQFVAVQTGASCAASTDGVNWNLRQMPSEQDWMAVGFGNERFLAIASNYANSAFSLNGTSWALLGIQYMHNWNSLCYGSNGFWLLADSSDTTVFVSDSGVQNEVTVRLGLYKNLNTITGYFLNESGVRLATLGVAGSGTWVTFVVNQNSIGLGTTDASTASAGAAAPLKFESITKLELQGPQTCDYVFVGDNTIPVGNETWTALLKDSTYHPNNLSRYFLADFENGSTNGGGIGTTGIISFAIYRYTPGEAVLKHIVDTNASYGNVIFDCGAVTGKNYTYYAYGTGSSNVVSSALISGEAVPCFWDWTVLSCTVDSGGVYHPQKIFRFGKNLVSGAVTNNNAPQILQNFTPYPMVQPAPQNYQNGTLQSLIGTVTNGKYADTAELKKELMELSVTRNTLFLKNRKGELLKIRVAGAISMETMDNTTAQAQSISLPWVEVGSAENAQIILTNADGAWPY